MPKSYREMNHRSPRAPLSYQTIHAYRKIIGNLLELIQVMFSKFHLHQIQF